MKAFHIANADAQPYTTPRLPTSRQLQPADIRRRTWTTTPSLWWIITLILWIPPLLHAQPQGNASAAARLVTHTLYMPQFNHEKQIWIYLPPNYGRDPHRRFPVLYMQDGQTLFEPQLTFPENSSIDAILKRKLRQALNWYGSWQLNLHLDRLVSECRTRGSIVVGISSAGGNRTAEYSPWAWYGALQPEAEQYLEFLVQTVKPYVDTHYLTLRGRRHTGIGGSSLGGLLALYGGLKYQQVFSRIAAFSPVLTPEVSGRHLTDYIRRRGRSLPMKIYVDLGSEELNFGPLQPIHDVLRTVGFAEDELKFRHIPGGQHRITDWSKRFPDALLWLEP